MTRIMNLLTVVETGDYLRLQVNYSEAEGTYCQVLKQPFSKAAQLRKLAVALRQLSERIEKNGAA